MTDRQAEPGHELVLDNRKLIIAFVVLIAFFGCFFVVGFMEGKRQGYQDGVQVAAESANKKNFDLPAQAIIPDDTNAVAVPPKEEAEDPQLNWYKSVNRNAGEPEIAPPPEDTAIVNRIEAPPEEPVTSKTAPKATPTQTVRKIAKAVAEKVLPQAKAADSERVSYSVQVGAFRARREVETKAKALRSEGYDPRIEVPRDPKELYLLKVGRYSSRAEAAAMQLRLKKSGFNSFIKIN